MATNNYDKKLGRDYPLSQTPTPKGSDELNKAIDTTRQKLKRAADVAFYTNVPALKEERQKTVNQLENKLDLLLKQKKG